jgi:hypothetical protein
MVTALHSTALTTEHGEERQLRNQEISGYNFSPETDWTNWGIS